MKTRADRLAGALPLAIMAVLVLRLTTQAATSLRDPDVWWHLRLGDDLIAQHSLAAPGHWSSFATVPWVPTEPLPEIATALTERWFGLPGVAWVFGLGVLLVVGSVYVCSRIEAGPLVATTVTALVALACSAALTPRPQLVSLMLLPLVVVTWLRTERDLEPRWWLVPLTWGWSLCHGFWIVGASYGLLAVVGIVLSRRASIGQLVRLSALAVGSIAVVALNPTGLGVLRAPFVVHSLIGDIAEWQRTDLLSPAALVGLLMIVTTVLLWSRDRSGLTWTRVLFLASAAFWVWYAVRTVSIGGIVTAPLLSGALDAVIAKSRGGKEAPPVGREAGVLVTSAVVALAVLAVLVPHTSARPGGVPLGLDASLDRLPRGSAVFNAYELGGWMTWRHRDLDQFIDGAQTPYSNAQMETYLQTSGAAPGSYRVIRRDRIRAAVIGASSPLVHVLARHGWVETRADRGYVLLEPPHA